MGLVRGLKPTGTLVLRKKLVCVDPRNNHNKYIVCDLHDTGDFFRAWGRVRADASGELVQHETAYGTEAGAGNSRFEQFVYSKTKSSLGPDKLYTVVDAVDSPAGSSARTGSSSSVSNSSLKKVAADQIESGCKETKALIDYLVDVNVHQITAATAITFNSTTGLFSTPLGIVTPASIVTARQKLDILGDCVAKRDWSSPSFYDAIEMYLRLIPHDVGHKLIPNRLFPDLAAIRGENDILDSLDASYVSATTQPQTTKTKKTKEKRVFEVKLDAVDDIAAIKKLFDKTRNRMHSAYSLHIHRVFAVDIKTMRDAFNKNGKPLGTIWRLWHGTKASNLLSILRGGLIIPPQSSPNVTGRMFGDGLYFSDQSTKSLNYAMGAAPGQSRSNVTRYFMFLSDVAMGNMEKSPSSWGRNYPTSPKFHSVFAKAGDAGLRNNEMIVYKTAQANLVYLVEFRP